MDRATLTAALNAAKAADWPTVIKLSSGTYRTDIWAAAMTAHYGPTGLHLDYLGSDGRPSAETIAQLPHVAATMCASAARAAGLIEYFLRHE